MRSQGLSCVDQAHPRALPRAQRGPQIGDVVIKKPGKPSGGWSQSIASHIPPAEGNTKSNARRVSVQWYPCRNESWDALVGWITESTMSPFQRFNRLIVVFRHCRKGSGALGMGPRFVC